jgi:Resolvase, N terminal domain
MWRASPVGRQGDGSAGAAGCRRAAGFFCGWGGPPAEAKAGAGWAAAAAGAIRVSSGPQGEGHSPQTQRAAVLARAWADGYAMDPEEDIYEDHQRGHKITRKGYVAILKGVRERRYSAVFCFMLDRWGRDSIERQQRGKEFDKLGE